MSYSTSIPTIVSLVLPLAATHNSRHRLEITKYSRWTRFQRLQIAPQAPFMPENASDVFIYALFNFYPYYRLFGCVSRGLQDPEYAKSAPNHENIAIDLQVTDNNGFLILTAWGPF